MALFLLRLSPDSLLLLTLLLNRRCANHASSMKAQSAAKELRAQCPALLRRELGTFCPKYPLKLGVRPLQRLSSEVLPLQLRKCNLRDDE